MPTSTNNKQWQHVPTIVTIKYCWNRHSSKKTVIMNRWPGPIVSKLYIFVARIELLVYSQVSCWGSISYPRRVHLFAVRRSIDCCFRSICYIHSKQTCRRQTNWSAANPWYLISIMIDMLERLGNNRRPATCLLKVSMSTCSFSYIWCFLTQFLACFFGLLEAQKILCVVKRFWTV